ncbi:hypothetical protein ACLOJK_027354 [Asimina triloba]
MLLTTSTLINSWPASKAMLHTTPTTAPRPALKVMLHTSPTFAVARPSTKIAPCTTSATVASWPVANFTPTIDPWFATKTTLFVVTCRVSSCLDMKEVMLLPLRPRFKLTSITTRPRNRTDKVSEGGSWFTRCPRQSLRLDDATRRRST